MRAYLLAVRVLEVLELQQVYFRTRHGGDLQKSKTAEQQLKKICKQIVAEHDPQTLLRFE